MTVIKLSTAPERRLVPAPPDPSKPMDADTRQLLYMAGLLGPRDQKPPHVFIRHILTLLFRTKSLPLEIHFYTFSARFCAPNPSSKVPNMVQLIGSDSVPNLPCRITAFDINNRRKRNRNLFQFERTSAFARALDTNRPIQSSSCD